MKNNYDISSASPPGMSSVCEDDHCTTCGDVADVMTVMKIDEVRQLALCEDGDGDRHTVEILLVQPVVIGDELLVHAGTAIARAESPSRTPAGAAEEVAA